MVHGERFLAGDLKPDFQFSRSDLPGFARSNVAARDIGKQPPDPDIVTCQGVACVAGVREGGVRSTKFC